MMLLVVDTSVLVADLLRIKGRERLSDHRLDLYLPEHTLGEVHVELPRRIGAVAASAGLDAAERDDLLMLCLDAVDNNLAVVAGEVYSPFEREALARSQRDPADWPVVACALALSAAVWTNDNDFLGTGVPTWTTRTLQIWLDRQG
ncbi:MAG: PIN domain-containing protein [bacterium]|nr:PIN domain-containing protein [bacterium]